MNKVFCIKHWGKGGEGSGSSIVVASCKSSALAMLKLHFDAKPDGYRQYTSMALLEVEDLDESTFAGDCVSNESCGVILEYWWQPEEVHPELIHLGVDVPALAEELFQLQSKHNGDRGVSCVRTMVHFLRRGELSQAKAVANNESDKIRSYPEIVAVLKRIGFWHEIAWLRD